MACAPVATGGEDKPSPRRVSPIYMGRGWAYVRQGRPLQAEGGAQAVLQVVRIVGTDAACVVDEAEQRGRRGGDLRGVVQTQGLAGVRGRGVERGGLAQHAVDLGGAQSLAVGGRHLRHGRRDALDAAAAAGGGQQDRRVGQEGQGGPDLGLQALGVGRRLPAGLHQVPLVDHAEGGAAPLEGVARDALILLRHAGLRIHHQHGDVGAGDGAQGAGDGGALQLGRDAGRAAHAGRVHQHEALGAPAPRHVDGVAGGAGQLADDQPLAPDEAVDQGGLAGVGPSDEGDPHGAGGDGERGGTARRGGPGVGVGLGVRRHRLGGRLARAGWAQGLHDGVQEVADAIAVDGRAGQRLAQAEGVELVRDGAVALTLVDRQHDAAAPAAQQPRDLRIRGQQPGLAVHDHDRHIRLSQALGGRAGDQGREGVALRRHQAPGVQQRKGLAGPVSAGLQGVARHARRRLDDGDPAADNAVEEGGLAHVGPADQGHARQRPHLLTCLPRAHAASAMPAAATLRTMVANEAPPPIHTVPGRPSA
jgi:hypothetical protein